MQNSEDKTTGPMTVKLDGFEATFNDRFQKELVSHALYKIDDLQRYNSTLKRSIDAIWTLLSVYKAKEE